MKEIIAKTKQFLFPGQENNYIPGILAPNVLTFMALFAIGLKLVSIGFFLPFPKNIFFADITKIELVSQLNAKRASAGLDPLTENSALDEAALLKAEDMVANNYFSHESPMGVTPWFWFGLVNYQYRYAGENLAVGFADTEDIFQAWLHSPSHRDNLLNPNYTEVGYAVVQGFGPNNAILVVQLFGNPGTTNTFTGSVSASIASSEGKRGEEGFRPASPDGGASPVPKKGWDEAEPNSQSSALFPDDFTDSMVLGGQQFPELTVAQKDYKTGQYYAFVNFIAYDHAS